MTVPAIPASRCRTAILDGDGDLRRPLPEGWALWRPTARATVLSSPARPVPPWGASRPGELVAAAARRGGLLVNFAPFCVEDGALRRRPLPLGFGVAGDLGARIDGAPAGAVWRVVR